MTKRSLGSPIVVLLLILLGCVSICSVVQAEARLVRRPAPKLDVSTPRRQDGFVLLQIQHLDGPGFHYHDSQPVESGSMGLWIHCPDMPSRTRLTRLLSYPFTAFEVSVRSATGATFAPEWSIEMLRGKRELFIHLPGRYPVSWRFLDVQVADQQGDVACWRIINLPYLWHTMPTPMVGQPQRFLT